MLFEKYAGYADVEKNNKITSQTLDNGAYDDLKKNAIKLISGER